MVKFDLQSVDVTYDTNIEQKELNFEDDVLKDRYSRHIGVMGMDAMKK